MIMKLARCVSLILMVVVTSILLTACGGNDVFSRQAVGQEAKVTNVEVIVAESDPPQYFAVVTGQLPDGCTEIGRTTQRVVGRTIRITMHTERPEDAVCTTAVAPFQETIPLDVSGLSAGQYSVEVNGVTASFNLTEDH
jgi:inhibitor of cysteine peptidase